MTPSLQILTGDCRETLRTLADSSVDCCVTSPPYWGLRDYGVAGQIGLETDLNIWLDQVVEVFREVRRVLRADGTCWVNMGDCYSGARCGAQGQSGQMADRSVAKQRARVRNQDRRVEGLKSKDMIGQPWRLAFALQADGWWLRRDIIWHKPNPMPETVHDRPTTAHEYIFLLTKSERYTYNKADAREPVTGNSHARGNGVNRKIKMPDGWETGEGSHGSFHRDGRGKGATRPHQNESFSSSVRGLVETRNWRSVWTIPTQPYSGAHFATFPTDIPRRCILAGCRMGGVVLDPFGGSGTTGQVALELGRSAILCELNPAYVELIRQRCAVTVGLPLEAST